VEWAGRPILSLLAVTVGLLLVGPSVVEAVPMIEGPVAAPDPSLGAATPP
jgi:hypothetical protein